MRVPLGIGGTLLFYGLSPSRLHHKIGAGDDAVDGTVLAGELADEHAVDLGVDGIRILAVDIADGAVPGAGVGDGGVEGEDIITDGVAFDGGEVDDLGAAVGLVGDHIEADRGAVLVEGYDLVGYDISVGCDEALGGGVEKEDQVGVFDLLGLGIEVVLESVEHQGGGVVLACGGFEGYGAYNTLRLAGITLDLCEVGFQDVVPELGEL